GEPTLLNVSRLIFEAENQISWGGFRMDGRRLFERNGGSIRTPVLLKLVPQLNRLVAHEDEHVPDVLRLVLEHREDHGVGAAGPKVVHEDVQELAQDLRVVVNREAVDRVQDDEGAPARVLEEQELDRQHAILVPRRGYD